MVKGVGSLISSMKYWGGVLSGVGLCLLLIQMFPGMPVRSAALGVAVAIVGVMLANLPQRRAADEDTQDEPDNTDEQDMGECDSEGEAS